MSERLFGRKVAHVVPFPYQNPTTWKAFFDGVYLGKASTQEKAKRLVEARCFDDIPEVSQRPS